MQEKLAETNIVSITSGLTCGFVLILLMLLALQHLLDY